MEGLYKVTGPDGESVHGGSYQYDLPDGDTPGAWTDPIDRPRLCHRGYHVTTDPMQWAKVGMRVWATEQRGLVDNADDDKRVASSIRLTRERPELVPDYWHKVEGFVGTIPDIPWFQPQGEPDPTWQVFDTMAAAWDAAWDAARDAARAAAWDAAWAAARDAAGDAAGDAAWAAAGDAGLMAYLHLCDGLNLDQQHVDHIHARWDVWQRGYGLLCDVDGVLYVYKAVV